MSILSNGNDDMAQMMIWHKWPQHPSQLFSPPSSATSIGIGPLCSFCLATIHPKVKFPDIPLQLCTTLIITGEPISFLSRNAVDGTPLLHAADRYQRNTDEFGRCNDRYTTQTCPTNSAPNPTAKQACH